MKKVIYIILALLSPTLLMSNTLQGLVLNSDNLPIEECTVVIPELDIIEYTLDDDSFVIETDNELSPNLELLFIAPGYLEKSVSINEFYIINNTIVLDPEVVVMEEITVTAKAEEVVKPSTTFTKEDLENTSTGNDPVQIIAVNSGILTGSEVLPLSMDDPFTTASGAPIPEFIVRGTPPEGNVYKYGNISMPTLYHSRGIPTARSIIPLEMVDSVEVLKGGYDVSSGPGVGGLFYFTPPITVPEESFSKVETSIINANFYSEQRFTDNFGAYFSLRKSLYDLTLQQIDNLKTILEYDDLTDMVKINYGDTDYLGRFIYNINTNNLLSLDVLGLYDYYNQEPFEYELEKESGFSQRSQKYIVNTQSITWSLLNNKFSNDLYFNNVNTINNDQWDFNIWRESVNNWELDFSRLNDSILNQTTFGDICNFNFLETFNFELGFEANLNYLMADSSYNNVYDNVYEKTLLDGYGYLNLDYTLNKFTFNGGYRFDYYELLEDGRHTVNGGIGYTYSDNLSINLSGGNYSGKLNYLTLLEGIDSTDYDITDAPKIPKMNSVNLLVNTKLSDGLNLKSEGYFNYIYNLDSFSSLLTSTAIEVGDIDLGDIDVGRLFGFEFNLDWLATDKFQLKSSYTISSTKYNATDIGWVRANSDYTHVVVLSSAFMPTKNLSFGANLKTLIGQPYTPFKVTGYDEETSSYIREYYELNSGNNMIPCFNLDLSVKYNTKWWGKDTKLYIDITNVVNGPTFIDSYDDYIGRDTTHFSDREYFTYSFIDLEESNIVMDFGISMTF